MSDVIKEIEDFAAAWEEWRHEVICKRWPNHKFEGVELRYSKAWAKVVCNSNGGGASAEAFIALEDGQSKTLGAWRQGDIFRPAGWSSPAKHARGNVFDANRMNCMSEYGVKSLPASNNGYGDSQSAGHVMYLPHAR